jgi:hypothetical protein
MVVAVIALMLALTGTSFAVAKLGKDTVGAKQLKVVTPRTAEVALPQGGQYAEATANCEPKEQLLGGGVTVDNQNVNEYTSTLENGPQGNGWTARMQNAGVTDRTMTVTALCLVKK